MPDSNGKCFQRDLTMMGTVLVSFKDDLLPCNHWTKSVNSWQLSFNSIVPRFWQ